MADAAKGKVVSREMAEKEVELWLQHRRVRESKRERLAGPIEDLIEFVQDGSIVIDIKGDFSIKQELFFPVGPKKSLTYKARIRNGEITDRLKGVSTEHSARIAAYVAAVSSETNGLISKIDTEDYEVGQTIALFFM